MNTEIKLTVTEIQRFCMHDGPGLRTTVFLKGCPLNCAWCHNPETKTGRSELLLYPGKCIGCRLCEERCPQGLHSFASHHTVDREKCMACGICADVCPTGAIDVCGKKYTVAQIVDAIKRDLVFYGEHGGVTLSGGEPFAQGKAAVELLKACKAVGISTAVETCGFTAFEYLAEAVPYIDLFLWDVKDTEDERHRKYVGVSNMLILENLKAVDMLGAKTRFRCILVNGVNTEEQHYRSLARLASSLRHFDGVDFLPYHAFGGAKAVALGLSDNGNKAWIPTKEEIDRAKKIFWDAYKKT